MDSKTMLAETEANESEQKVLYLEDLLHRQVARLRKYDLDGAMQIAEQISPLARAVAAEGTLERPQMAEVRRRIKGLYQEVTLTIAAERQEVADKLKQIREGLRVLSKYSGK